jgi:hypothetical protein
MMRSLYSKMSKAMGKKPKLGYLELYCGQRSGSITIAFDFQMVRPETIEPVSDSRLPQCEREASQYWGAAVDLLKCFTKESPGTDIILGKARSSHRISSNTSHIEIERSFQGFPKQGGDWDQTWLFMPVESEWWEEMRGVSAGYVDLYVFPFSHSGSVHQKRVASAERGLRKIKSSVEIAVARIIGFYLGDEVISLSLQDPIWEELGLPPYGLSGFEFQGLILDTYEAVIKNASVKTHRNILFLTKRMDDALQRRDYAGVLHASASIFETMAKDIVGIPSIQDQALGSFFKRYCADSRLPPEVLDYVSAVYDSRSKTPLAGHGSTQIPDLDQETAVALCELTRAIVRIEYRLRGATSDRAG